MRGNALPLNLVALWRCGLLQMLCYPFVVSNGSTALYQRQSLLLVYLCSFFCFVLFCFSLSYISPSVYPLLIATESVC